MEKHDVSALGLALKVFHVEQSDDKTWFFLGEDNNIIFSLTLEWQKGYTPPAELVELIELYSQGYRRKK